VWEETASRERVVAELSRTIKEETAKLGRLLEEREQESARIDARGLPVVGFGILLSGVPDELAAIPFPWGGYFRLSVQVRPPLRSGIGGKSANAGWGEVPHGYVDLYKWSYKLTPLLPSELVLDCFRLARDVRELDMRASPYDLADLGYPPVRVETPEGRAEYVRAQRGFADRSQVLRAALLARLGRLDVAVGTG
jgi:hypothetical protein